MARNQVNIIAGILIVVAMVMVALPSTKAQPPVPSPGPTMAAAAPSPDCLTSLANMSDCLTYVEAGSNLTKPDDGCCPELAGLVESNPICLCQLLGDPGKTGIAIDLNKALKLPSVCSVDTPSVSLCAAIGIPVGAPMASEGPSSPKASPGDMAPEGSATSPTTSVNSDNGGLSIATTMLQFFAGIAVIILTNFF